VAQHGKISKMNSIFDAKYLEVFCVARSCTLHHLRESTFLIAQKILR